MANHTSLASLFSDIADAIRAKTGGSSNIIADNFPTAISQIPTGGSASLGTKNITANGTYDAEDDGYDGYSSVNVNVSGGGGGLEYETGTWTPSEDVATGEILFTNTHAQPPFFFVITDVDGDQHTNLLNTNAYAVFTNWNRILGTTIYPSSTSTRFGSLTGAYRRTQTSDLYVVTRNFSNDTYAANYATNTSIRPFLNSSSYWRAGYNYKWIAVWAPTT